MVNPYIQRSKFNISIRLSTNEDAVVNHTVAKAAYDGASGTADEKRSAARAAVRASLFQQLGQEGFERLNPNVEYDPTTERILFKGNVV